MKINEAFYLRHETWGSIQNWLLAKYLPVTIWNSYNMGLINLWVEGLLSVSWVNISERAKLVTPDLLSQRNHLGPLLRMLLFSHRVMSDSLRSHGLQHARLPCPSPSPGVCSDSCPVESVMLSNHLICCCSLFLTSIFPSIRVFSSESALPISFSISPSNEYWELIIFRIDSFDLFAVQGTLRSLLQHYSSKASFLHCSAFFLIQLSHHTWLLERPYLWLYGPLSAKWVYGRENTSLYVCIEEREHGFMREHIK